MSGRWVDLREAAELLGTSTEAVRKRATRGSLRSDRQNGRVLVWVDDGRTEGGHEVQVDGGPLVEVLRDEVADLRARLDKEQEARRRADTIIAQLTQANAALAQRVPELEPPRKQAHQQEPPGGSERVVEEPERAEPWSATGSAHGGPERPPDNAEWPMRGGLLRPWWRRVFGT
jgi:hypothetical protein